MYQSLIANLLVKDGQIDSLIKIVERDYLISIEEMAAVAFVFFREENKTVEKYSKERLCQLMIDEINKDIPRKDQIIPLCIERDNYHKLFVDEVVDFSLPTDYSLKIDWDSNTNYQSEKLIKLMLVNLFADSCFLQIKLKPIPSAIGWIAQLSTLRDYNRAHLRAAMLLDGFPIHYYFWFKKRNELPLTVKVFPDQQYLAGFTYNFASTLAASGLGGYDQLLEFVILNNFARVCFNALVELKYYLKQYSKPQVDSLFVASKLFNLNKSISLVKDITCYPGQKLQTYWGIRTFKKLEEKCFNYQKRKFRKKEFYKFVLKQGPLPLDLLEERLFSHFLK